MGCEAPLIDISADKVAQFETEVMMIPQYNTAKPQMISQGPSMCIFNKEDPQEVLASWLFMQFLLTDSVQIAYSQTEGYLPVTTKAQSSAAYTDYLAREGEDNNLYYDVKLKATKLLLDHVDDTFTTPVFNGSASLRDAAGQMITEVTKSIRRKQNVDAEYLDKLFSDMTSLYRLDRIETSGGKIRFGALPTTAVVLLTGIAAAWILISAYLIVEVFKKHRQRHKK
jgi:multiple sugar transport system substrate-binding protein